VQINAAQFDNELLYTTHWVAPHHDNLPAVERWPGWEGCKAARVLELELNERGLTFEDVAIDADDLALTVALPEQLDAERTSLLLDRPHGEGVKALRPILSLACCNLARERMMRAVGWTRGAPPPPWSLLTTPLTEHVLGLSGYCSYDLWSLPKKCFDMFGRLVPPGDMTGDARDALPLGFQAMRVGPLLRLEGLFGTGVRFAQGVSTRIVMPRAGLKAQAAAKKRNPVVQDFGSVGSGPTALYLNRRSVRGVYHLPPDEQTRVLEIDMPMITMDEIPEAALSAIGIKAPREARRFPYWSIVSQLTRGGDAVPGRRIR